MDRDSKITMFRKEKYHHVRLTIHWGPRTLDLDILFYDDCIIDSPELTVPHIDMQNRGFVLIPMAQIAPYHRHPVLGCTVGQLLSRLDGSLS